VVFLLIFAPVSAAEDVAVSLTNVSRDTSRQLQAVPGGFPLPVDIDPLAPLGGGLHQRALYDEAVQIDQPTKTAGLVECSLDATQGTAALALAGIAINAAVGDCQNQASGSSKAGCTATVSSIVSAFVALGSFLSGAVWKCGEGQGLGTNVQAACSEDTTSIIGTFADVANVGASLTLTCQALEQGDSRRLRGSASSGTGSREDSNTQPAWWAANTTHAGDTTDARLLQPLITGSGLAPGDAIAECVIDAVLVTTELMRAGVNINLAVGSCAESAVGCTADVSGVVTSFSAVASTLSAMVATCPAVGSLRASCAADVTAAIAIIANFISSGTSVSETCVQAISGGHACPGCPRLPG